MKRTNVSLLKFIQVKEHKPEASDNNHSCTQHRLDLSQANTMKINSKFDLEMSKSQPMAQNTDSHTTARKHLK